MRARERPWALRFAESCTCSSRERAIHTTCIHLFSADRLGNVAATLIQARILRRCFDLHKCRDHRRSGHSAHVYVHRFRARDSVGSIKSGTNAGTIFSAGFSCGDVRCRGRRNTCDGPVRLKMSTPDLYRRYTPPIMWDCQSSLPAPLRNSPPDGLVTTKDRHGLAPAENWRELNDLIAERYIFVASRDVFQGLLTRGTGGRPRNRACTSGNRRFSGRFRTFDRNRQPKQ